MTFRSSLVPATSVAILLLCAACGGETLDLGDTQAFDSGVAPTSPDAGPTTVTTYDGDYDGGSDVATSESTPPYGIWAMSVQYGPVGQAVTPTPAYQVELRPDGTAYRWVCAGDPDDGSVTTACPVVARAECLSDAQITWTGVRWQFVFDSDIIGIPNQGYITPDGKGDILIDYVNPTYSGGLFRRVSDVPAGDPGCTP